MRMLLVIGLGACVPASFPERPGQEAALAAVRAQFGAELAPPPVEWREDMCPNRPGRTAVVYHDACYGGLYLRDDHALVAWRGSFHESAFAHELMHAWQWARGIDDPDHTREADWDLVASANKALEQLDGSSGSACSGRSEECASE